MKFTRCLILVALVLAVLPVLAGAQCPESLSQSSTNADSYLGLHPAGQRYGVGQSLNLECDSRFELASFRVGWGPAIGEVRSLTVGDTLFCEVRKDDLTLLAVSHVLIPDATGLRYLDFDFLSQDVLLPAGDYLVTCYTKVDAAGSLSFCNACTHDGTRWLNPDSNDSSGWAASTGDLAYTINLDWEVTPVEVEPWGMIKSLYK